MKISTNIGTLSVLLALGTPALAKMPVDLSIPDRARPGETVNVTVKTEPSAKCKIEAQDSGLSQSLKLFDQTSDSVGRANWRFDIPKNYKANEMPVTVTVSKDGEEDKAIGSIKIKK